MSNINTWFCLYSIANFISHSSPLSCFIQLLSGWLLTRTDHILLIYIGRLLFSSLSIWSQCSKQKWQKSHFEYISILPFLYDFTFNIKCSTYSGDEAAELMSHDNWHSRQLLGIPYGWIKLRVDSFLFCFLHTWTE